MDLNEMIPVAGAGVPLTDPAPLVLLLTEEEAACPLVLPRVVPLFFFLPYPALFALHLELLPVLG